MNQLKCNPFFPFFEAARRDLRRFEYFYGYPKWGDGPFPGGLTDLGTSRRRRAGRRRRGIGRRPRRKLGEQHEPASHRRSVGNHGRNWRKKPRAWLPGALG
ncbi:MAG: hypothetical protein MI923_12955 [Phycisphaerales bacterium]|nr:hypothetical protein [Phycisphaerales bacterium]